MAYFDTPSTEDPFTILNPKDDSEIGTIVPFDKEKIASMVAMSKIAQSLWAEVPPEQRGKILSHAADVLADHSEELASLNSKETGRAYEEALGGIRAGVSTFKQYSELGPLHRGKSLQGSLNCSDYSIFEPRGVVACLTPWNDPIAIAAGLLGAALVTGNSVIHKPSERCSHLGIRLGEILAPCFPENVLITLPGTGITGQRLITQDDIDVVAHVGSSATGSIIAAQVGNTNKAHLIRENGGNDALIIDKDVNPTWAATQASLGAFANSGQICTSVERIFVHRDIADQFCQALITNANDINNNSPLAPLVDKKLRNLVHKQVSEAIELGAKAEVGGFIPQGKGSYYPATVLLNCTPEMTIMKQETFGPVAPIQVVDSFDEALKLATDDTYGLAATILTSNIENSQRAISKLRVGTVKINNVFGGAPGGSAQPQGQSGAGFGYGPELLDEMTTTKVVHIEPPQTL